MDSPFTNSQTDNTRKKILFELQVQENNHQISQVCFNTTSSMVLITKV